MIIHDEVREMRGIIMNSFGLCNTETWERLHDISES